MTAVASLHTGPKSFRLSRIRGLHASCFFLYHQICILFSNSPCNNDIFGLAIAATNGTCRHSPVKPVKYLRMIGVFHGHVRWLDLAFILHATFAAESIGCIVPWMLMGACICWHLQAISYMHGTSSQRENCKPPHHTAQHFSILLHSYSVLFPFTQTKIKRPINLSLIFF